MRRVGEARATELIRFWEDLAVVPEERTVAELLMMPDDRITFYIGKHKTLDDEDD